jgi:AcrR family transcriptional regulator
MSGNMRHDRRVARTRGALIDAYNRLFLGRRRGPFRVAEVVSEAEIGRSTFYEHYRGIDDIFLEALKRPFAALADGAAGTGDAALLEPVLAHFWENRQRGREALGGRLGERVARLLADMVEERIAGAAFSLPPRLAARTLAEAGLAPLRSWIAGEATATAAQLSAAICRIGIALRSALYAPQVQSAR